MKQAIIAFVVIVLIGAGAYYYFAVSGSSPSQATPPQSTAPATTTTQKQTTQPAASPSTTESVIGTSVDGNPIMAYHYGTGSDEILFIGDVHGGYTPSTALLAYQALAYFKSNASAIPSNESVTIIPVMNPDGLKSTVGVTTGDFTQADIPSSVATQIAGRFNAHKVDLNRNFGCDWQPTAPWGGITLSGGAAAFSEPESQAVRDYIQSHHPKAVVVWYASAGAVYASSCNSAPSAETVALAKAYAGAAGYDEYERYTSNPIPGDLTNWVAEIGTPAISVLLKSRTTNDWAANLAGIKAVLAQYAK